LLEILITIGIALVIILVYYVASNSMAMARGMKNQDLALKIAENKIEVLRSAGYDSLPASGSFSDSLLSSLPSGTATMTITDYNSSVKKLTVTVSWIDTTGARHHSVALNTLLAKIGGF